MVRFVNALAWPDIAIVVVVLFGALRGLKVGLVRELTGVLALAVGILAAFRYPGMWDEFIVAHWHAAAGAAHIIGMVAYAAVAYAIVLALGSALSIVAKLPLLNLVNAVGGAAVGAAKGVVFVWIALYVALFFPLPQAVRDDLHRSLLVAQLERPNDRLDTTLRATLPPAMVPFAHSLFEAHHV